MAIPITASMSPTERQFRLGADWEIHEKTVIALPDRSHSRFPKAIGRQYPNFDLLSQEVIRISHNISKWETVLVIATEYEMSKWAGVLKTPDQRRERQFRASFSNPHNKGMNMDIRYSTPLFVDEVSPGSDYQRAIIATKEGSGTANAKRGQKERQCTSFSTEYLESMTDKGRDIIQERWYSLPIAWDTSAFNHDGCGTFIVSKALLAMWPQNQNSPEIAIQYVEGNMNAFMGANTFIWIDQKPEHTDRPLSSMVRFVRCGHVLISRPPVFDDTCPWVELYTIIFGTLNSCRDRLGERMFKITEIVEAHPSNLPTSKEKRRVNRCGSSGWPLLSYLTYIHVKKGVLFPRFGDKKADQAALEAFSSVFLQGKCDFISAINVGQLPWWGSSLYSITQHIPQRTDQRPIPAYYYQVRSQSSEDEDSTGEREGSSQAERSDDEENGGKKENGGKGEGTREREVNSEQDMVDNERLEEEYFEDVDLEDDDFERVSSGDVEGSITAASESEHGQDGDLQNLSIIITHH